jgi:hypothetical protein
LLPFSNSRTCSFSEEHPVAAYVFFLVFSSLLSLHLPFSEDLKATIPSTDYGRSKTTGDGGIFKLF